MKIGYSFWGFIGPGITNTPDGGRSFRRTLLDALTEAGHQLILLQANRDLTEAGDDLTTHLTWDAGLPELDALFLEWRWPLPGRNTTACGSPGHTCDLHRQQDLLDHYTHRLGVPTIAWDLDRMIPANDPIRRHLAVTVCEPATFPTPGAVTLRCPVADRVLDAADPAGLVTGERPWPLVYVGNQYGRDPAFDQYFAPAARVHRHQVAGKWTDTAAWPHVNFVGRVGFLTGQQLHHEALATVLLMPERYATTGAVSQRLAEAVLAGCLPIGPADIRAINRFVPPDLQAADGGHVARIVTCLANASDRHRAELLAACLIRLDQFRASRQIATIHQLLNCPTNAEDCITHQQN
ncbi:hypothetical protein ACIHFE_20435 [Streptomyces sp. NPDC052396]|uniref:hypothetical protein n=1 Tax=Streptomyces sp. NPDC052396 TaxID=3365689 RepID=UPI0037CF045D